MASLIMKRARKDWLFALMAIITLGLPRVFIQTAASTTFLKIYGASSLAPIYLAVALAIPLCMTLFLRLEGAVSRFALLRGTQLGRIAVLGLLWIGGQGENAGWFAIAALIWLEVEFVLGSLVFWGLAAECFNITETKRSYPLLAAGEQLGAMLGGLVAASFIAGFRVIDLYLAAALAIALSIALMPMILRSVSGTSLAARVDTKRADDRPPRFHPVLRRYLALMLACAFLANLGYYLVDNLFYRSIDSAFASEAEMASFIGATFGIAGAVTLLFSLTAAGPALARYGVAVAVSWLPVTLGVITTVLVFGNVFPLLPAGASFVLITALKICDDGLRICIYRPAFQTLYQPLPPAQRIRALARSEGLAEPLGIAAAGLAIMLASWLGLGPIALGLVGLVTFTAWTGATFGLRWAYIAAIDLAVRGRQNDHMSGEALYGHDAKALLIEKLSSPSVSEAIGAMELLSNASRPLFLQFAPGLILAGAPPLALAALAKLEPPDVTALAPIFKNRYLHDPDELVRRAMFAALAAGEHETATPVLMAQLRAEGPFQHLALPALVRRGPPQAAQAAIRRLKKLSSSASPDHQQLFLAAVGRSGLERFDRDIVRFFSSHDRRLARTAMRAAGLCGRPGFIAPLLQHLGDPAVAAAAAAALTAIGSPAVPALGEMTGPAAPLMVRLASLDLLGKIATPDAQAKLSLQQDEPEPLVSAALARAMLAARIGLSAAESKTALRQASALFDAAAAYHAMGASLSGLQGSAAAVSAILQQAETATVGALMWLALRKRLFDIRVRDLTARRGSASSQLYRNELVLSLAPLELRSRAMALMSLHVASAPAVGPEQQPLRTLTSIMSAPASHLPWTRAAAIALAASLGQTDPALRTRIAGETSLAGEAARQSLHAGHEPEKVHAMALTSVEKILLLKGFELFRLLPDDILASFAPAFVTASYSQGETIAWQGSPADSLFLLTSGQIAAQADGTPSRMISATAMIDELAALSPARRLETYTAASDCIVLVVTHDDMEAMIGADPGASAGVVRLLGERLQRAGLR